MKAKVIKTIKNVGVAIFWLCVWAIIALLVGDQLLLPTPITVFLKLVELVASGGFWASVGFSLLRVISGFVLGTVLGILLAVLTVRFKLMHTLFAPLMSLIKSVPVASFIMLVILVFKRDTLPVFICLLMIIPVIWSNVSLGLRSVPKMYIEVADVYKMPLGARLKKLYMPWTMPYLAEGMATALGFAWKAGIAAEVLCLPKLAIGYQIYSAKQYLETPELFAWTVVVVVLSLMLEAVLRLAVKKLKNGKLARRRQNAAVV